MANHKIVETIYGKYCKYDIIRVSKTFGGYEFYIYRDGKYHRGTFPSLSSAVEAARKEG